MSGSSKILTVSYGTFSCTLEGFDDPFNTMKSIAEYFRDLAAKDRYFGAEPPQPDPATLRGIAEHETNRQIAAEEGASGVVLRQTAPAAKSDRQPASLPSPAPDFLGNPIARARGKDPALRGSAGTIAAALSAHGRDGAAMPGGVASKLQRIRDAVAQSDAAVPLTPSVYTDAGPTDLASSFAAGAFEDEDFDADIFDADATPAPLPDAPLPDSPLPDAPQPDAPSARPTDQAALPAPAALPEVPAVAFAVDDPFAPIPEVDRAAPAAVPGAIIFEEIDEAYLPELVDIADALPEDAPADPGTDPAADADDEARRFAELDASHDDDAILIDDPSAEDYDPAMTDDDLADDGNDALPGTPRPKPLSLPDDVREEIATQLQAHAESDAEADAALQAELQALAAAYKFEPEPEPEPEPVLADEPRKQQLDVAADDDDVSRLLEQTNTEMAEPENRRRVSAIAHLKAAVAASTDEKWSGKKTRAEAEANRMEPYRDALAQVVRPAEPDEEKPRAEKPAPLVLVSAQRIDRAPLVLESAIRPRRVTPVAVAMHQAAKIEALIAASEEAEDGDDEALVLDVDGARDFAAELGARDAVATLEAAAAYAACVEGRTEFTRPQLLNLVEMMDESGAFDREDHLRGFGILLREDRIVRIKGGRFALAEGSHCLAEARRIAG